MLAHVFKPKIFSNPRCFQTQDVFIPKMFSSAFVWPFPQRGGQIPSLGKLDAKMQILLHLKRFTKSRVCIRDTDSPSRDLEGMNKTAKNGTDARKKETSPWKKGKQDANEKYYT